MECFKYAPLIKFRKYSHFIHPQDIDNLFSSCASSVVERARFTSESSTFVKNANVPRKVRGNRNRIDFFIYSILQNFPNNDRAIRSRIFITYDTGGFVQRASIVAIRIHEAFTFEEGKINGFDGRRRFLRGQVPLRAIRLPRKRYRRWCCCNKRGTRKNSIKKKKTINPFSLLFPFYNLRIFPPFQLLPLPSLQLSKSPFATFAARQQGIGIEVRLVMGLFSAR